MENPTIKTNKNEVHPLKSTWVIWYHNPSDNNWETNSYYKLYEINTLEDFFMFQNTWKNNLPRLNLSMMFMMKKLDNYEYIYPMWEDKNNQPGGCWSFKVPSTTINNVWLQLCFHILTNNVGLSEEVNNTINGISFSPKKGFCIVKIWNSTIDIQTINSLNNDINEFMDLKTCIYKSHIESIDKDIKKKKKIEDFRNNIDKQDRNRINRRNKNKERRSNTSGEFNNKYKKTFPQNYHKETSQNYVDYKKRFNTNSKFVWGKKVS